MLLNLDILFDDKQDYDIYFRGQPVYEIKRISKLITTKKEGEITYLERNEIEKAIRLVASLLDIERLYSNVGEITDARLRHLVKETYDLLLENKKNKE